MVSKPKQDYIENLRDRLKTNDDILDRDADAIRNWSRNIELIPEKYSVHRHHKLLTHLVLIAEGDCASLSDALDDREAAEDIVLWIHRNYPKSNSEDTNRDFRGAVRMFGKRIGETDDIPPSIAWISATVSSDYDKTPDASEMLDWHDDVLSMIEEARYSRDEAMVALCFDLGARSSEFRELTVGSIVDADGGMKVRIDGAKGTGLRDPDISPSVPYVNRWLSDHPAPDDPDAPLWTKLHSAEDISYNMKKKIFVKAAERAGVEKPVTFTSFRKSRASDLASKGMSQAHLEERMGWVRGSDVAARYIAVFDDDASREFRRLEGEEIEDEDEPLPTAPHVCPRCDKESPRHKPACVWCGQPLDAVAASRLDEARKLLTQSVAEADDDLTQDDLMEILDSLDVGETRAALAEAILD